MLRKTTLICLISIFLSQYAENAFAQNFNIYFGDLHQHSIYSWDAKPGALKPAEAYAHAKHVARIDFMALTDHTNDLLESHYQDVRTAAQQYENPDSEFVAIAGQELGSLGRTGYGHMNIFEPLTRADNSSDNDTRYDLQHAYQFLIDNDLLGQFNHPTTENGNSNFNDLALHAPVDSQISALELINGKRSSNYEKFYLQALGNGWHLGAVGDQDNHAGFYGDQVSSGGDIYLTGLLAEHLNKDEVLQAIESHRTYAFQTSPPSDRIYLTEFTADGHWLGENFKNDDNLVSFHIAAHAENKFMSAQLYKNGQLLQMTELNSNDFVWNPTDSASSGSVYYFLKLVQEDMDLAWSSPIWVDAPGEYQPETKITPIADLRENLSNGLPRALGLTNVTVRGIATVGNQFGVDGPGYIQDETGGIAVFGSVFVEKVIPGFALEFEVTGVVSFFNGQTEILPYSATRLELKSFPAPIQVRTSDIANNGEAYEGSLVTILNADILGSFPPAGVSGNVSLDDGSGVCTMRIDGDTDIAGAATPNDKVNIVGVVGQYDTDAPYTSGYQFLPRSQEDIDVITDVETGQSGTSPKRFALAQNYPNPFNPETMIGYSVARPGNITIKIYNLTGQSVRTLVDEAVQPGEYQVKWDGLDDHAKQVTSGVYVYRFEAEGVSFVRKMILLR